MTQENGRVVVVGSLNADLVLELERIPSPGETVTAGDPGHGCGGKGANQAVAASRAGAVTAMVGCVGDDAAGTSLVEGLSNAGVDVDGVERLDVATGLAVVMVERSGENAIVVAPGANARCSPDLVRGALAGLSADDVVVAQAEIPMLTVAAAARCAASAGARFVLNLAPSRVVDASLLGDVSVLVVNEHEAGDLHRLLGGDDGDAATTARGLAEATDSIVVITLGAEGALLVDGTAEHRIPAIEPDRVVDTTGAGDAFVGALAAALAAGEPIEQAVRWGAAAGSIAVAAPGAQGGHATPDVIRSLLG